MSAACACITACGVGSNGYRAAAGTTIATAACDPEQLLFGKQTPCVLNRGVQVSSREAITESARDANGDARIPCHGFKIGLQVGIMVNLREKALRTL